MPISQIIKNEYHYLIAALMFYTRIPCPRNTVSNDLIINKSRKYFSLIGWLVGGLAIATVWGGQFFLPLSISILLSMIITVLATGAFHEDGFADTCDSFGGGWDKKQILTIMKDSRIGAYALVGLLLLLLLKFMALYELAKISLPLLFITYLNAHICSRFIASMAIQTHDYVQDIDKSKAKPITAQRLSFAEMTYSALFMLAALLLFSPNWLFLLAMPISYLAKIYLCHYFSKHIGGYTGDCLGAIQQVSEVVFYLSILVITHITLGL